MNNKTNEWFSSRNLESRQYQIEILDKLIPESLENNSLPTVLAAAPSSGKTIISIKAIEDYLKAHPKSRVLVLAHGQRLLRTQFYDTMVEVQPNYTFCMIESKYEYEDCTEQVVITLPQTINNIKDLGSFDLLVVDEAHQFYFAPTVQEIIKKTKPQHRLLLTGTPSDFILRNYPIIPVTVMELLDGNHVSDIIIENVISNYNLNHDNFDSQKGILKTDTILEQDSTNKTLDSIVEAILKRLKSKFKNKPELFSIIKTNTKYSIGFGELKKTMIACHSQKQAKEIKKYLELKGISTALSISDTDDDSTEIERFKNEDTCLILLVVGRGVLGFNMPTLVNVIDMTLSHNVNRIFQLMTRTIRKHPNGDNKIFFKVAPPMFAEYFKHIMTCTLMLTHKDWYLKFNGTNFLNMEVPIKQPKRSSCKTKQRKKSCKTNTNRNMRPAMIDGVPAIKMFKDLMVKMNSNFDGYAYVRMGEVKQTLYNISDNKAHSYWDNSNNIWDEVKKCKTYTEFTKTPSAYSSARKFKMLTDIRNYFNNECKKLNGHWDNPNNIWDEVKKCKTYTEFTKTGAYGVIYKNSEIILKIKKYFNCKIRKPKNYWNLERAMEDASIHKTKKSWELSGSGGYSAAFRYGWLNECSKHMDKVYWIKKRVFEDAKKYNSRSEWARNSGGAYKVANKNGWMDEACKHMNVFKKTWTKEEIFEDAKEHKQKTEWNKNNPAAYGAAYRNGWMDEACKHMNTKKTYPRGHWNIEENIWNDGVYKFKTYNKFCLSSANHGAKRLGIIPEIKKYFGITR